jgi:serine/threonine protein kinase
MKCPRCRSENPDAVKFRGECGIQLTSSNEASPSVTKTLDTPVQALTPGTLFADRYEIIEELGRGGIGAVYRVEDINTKEEIALKLIKTKIATEKKTIDRIRNTMTTALNITHRNVCRMFDLSESDGTHCIAMEYVSGGDSKKLIRRTRRTQ